MLIFFKGAKGGEARAGAFDIVGQSVSSSASGPGVLFGADRAFGAT